MAYPRLPSSALHCCQDHAAEAVGDDERERRRDDEHDRCDIPNNHPAKTIRHPRPIGTKRQAVARGARLRGPQRAALREVHLAAGVLGLVANG
jgi:hypothetical protein